MNRYYTDQDISQFFNEFKLLSNSFKIERVHQLLNNPNAKATNKVHFSNKHLKLIIMTGILLTGVVTLFLLHNSNPEIEMNSIEEISSVKNKVIANEKKQLPSKTLSQIEQSDSMNEKLITENLSLFDSSKTHKTNIENVKLVEAEPLNINEIVDSTICSKIDNQDCDWPSDTVVDKSTLLIELTDSELKDIGIVKHKYKRKKSYGYAIYYDNVASNGTQGSTQIEPDYIPDEKKVQTNFEFYRVITTSINYEPYFRAEFFYSSLDTLVPIILRISNPEEFESRHPDEIYWFNPHKSLFDKLPERYSYLRGVYDNLRCLKSKYPEKSFTNYLSRTGNNIYTPVNSFNLSNDELKQIGINIYGKCMVMQSKDKRSNSSFCVGADYDKNQNYYDRVDFVHIEKNSFPVLETDTFGRLINYNPYNYESNEIAKTNLDILLPIKIDKNKLLGSEGKPIEIWWYYPSDEFIDRLPTSIKTDLQLERDAILSENKEGTSECNFFEVCNSNLDVDNFKVYPNPTDASFKIDFSLDETATGEISIFNINGSQIKIIVPETEFSIGFNSYDGNISNIPLGIYILSIRTDKGFKTQRIIKSN